MTPKIFLPLAKLPVPPEDAMYKACKAGHESHNVIDITVKLDGQPKGIQDVPPTPLHLRLPSFPMRVYAWRDYFNVQREVPLQKYDNYCPGQDIISYSIDMQGTWEQYETLLALDILNTYVDSDRADVVVDFGLHVGWYSMLALLKGYKVAGIDASAENLMIAEYNALSIGKGEDFYPYLGWVNGEGPNLPANAENIHLVKCDIEGAESSAMRMIYELLLEKKVNYALFEISPTFNNTYPVMVETMAEAGYKVYQIPGKGWEHSEEFGHNPLTTLKKYCEIPAEGRKEYVESLAQENFLFIREGL